VAGKSCEIKSPINEGSVGKIMYKWKKKTTLPCLIDFSEGIPNLI